MLRPLAAVVTLALIVAVATPATAAQSYDPSFHSFTLTPAPGLTLSAGSLTLAGSGTTTGTYTDPYLGTTIAYDSATWTSEWFATPTAFTELVASWNADTPEGTWIETRMRAEGDKGRTKWYVMGRWAYGDETIYRTSVGGQGDADGFIATDTFFAKDHPMTAYELQVELFRAQGSGLTPRLDFIGAVASDAPNLKGYVPSPLGGAEGTTVAVPAYSQEIHKGDYPEYDKGGEAWCSPTSTSMILRKWFPERPGASEYAYVLADPRYGPEHPDPWIDYAARYVYDYRYQGAGNWPFNTAYAAHFGLRGFVTQLRSLNEAERFVTQGIPLVASIAFTSNKLSGFLFKSTGGHLLTIVGFDAAGNVISNDPDSASDATVPHVYDRRQFERDWLASTGGIVYVIYDPARASLPPSAGNW